MNKILVTGCAGFIGSNLCDELINNYNVVGIDNLSSGKKENINPAVEFYKLDINSPKVFEILKGVDTIFHMAAMSRIQPSIKKPELSHSNNLNGTFSLLQAAVKQKVRRIIFSSSSSIYGIQKKFPESEDLTPNPLNPYAAEKQMGEIYMNVWANCYGIETVCLRYFNVYGPRQIETGPYATVIGILLNQKKKNQPLTLVGDGKKKRDFTHVSDVVRANVLAMKSQNVGSGEIINIGSTKTYSLLEVAKIVGSSEIRFIPDRRFEAIRTEADVSLAKKLLSWSPEISLKQGIKELKND